MKGIGWEGMTLKELKSILEASAERRAELFGEARDSQRWRRTSEHPRLAPIWEQVREEAEHYASEPLEALLFSEFVLFGRTGDRTTYQRKYYERRRRLTLYTLLYSLEGGERWLRAIEDMLWAICDEYTWVLPAHVGLYRPDYPLGIWDQPEPPRETVDLFAGETAFAMAEIVSLLRETLDPWVVHRVQQEIDRRIFQVFFRDPVPQNWELKTNNWPAVCASSIGGAAIYLIDDAERLSGMLWRVLQSLDRYLSGFDEQGATPEGFGYWQFGFGFFTYFSELLRERTAGAVNLLHGERVQRIARFPGACLLSGGKTINFSDAAEDVEVLLGLQHRLKALHPSLNIPEAEPARVLQDWVPASRNLLWALDDEGGLEINPAVRRHEDHFFRGHQWVIAKTLKPERLIAFAAKGGTNGEPHNHNDLGHYMLHVGGVQVLSDLGAGEYTRDYFRPEHRYELLTAGSHGHSVPILDGRCQSYGNQYSAQVLHYEATEEGVCCELDLTGAYELPELDTLRREFTWKRKGEYELIIRDTFRFQHEPRNCEEVVIAGVEPRAVAPGVLDLGQVEMNYDHEAWRPTVEPLVLPGNNGVRIEAWRIVLKALACSVEMSCELSYKVKDAAAKFGRVIMEGEDEGRA